MENQSPCLDPVRPSLEAQSLNHWATREVPTHKLFKLEGGELLFVLVGRQWRWENYSTTVLNHRL